MIKAMQARLPGKWPVIAGWTLLYFFWVLVFQKREFAFSRTATIEFCYLVFIALNYYFNVQFTIPRFLLTRRYVSFSLLLLSGIAVTALLRVPLATYLNRHYFIPGQPQPGFIQLFNKSVLNISIWVIVILGVKLALDQYRFQQN